MKNFFLLFLVIIYACNTKSISDNKHNTLQDTFLLEMNKISYLPNNFYFNNKENKLKPIPFSNRFFDLMENQRSKIIESGVISNDINIIQIRNDHLKGIQGLSEFSIDLYGRINLQNQYFNFLSVMNSKSKAGFETSNWFIISLDSNGKFISNMNKVDEFRIIGDTIVCLWYYASDNYPTYESWIQTQEGIFSMIKQDTIKPASW